MEIVSIVIHVGKKMFQGKRILIIGAHPDDIEFGMGATLNQIKDEEIKIVVFSSTTERNGNLILSELRKSMDIYGLSFTLIKDIPNMHFQDNHTRINQILYDIKNEFKPDIIMCTSKRSVNPDHKTLAESVLAVFQEHTILYYEVVRGDYEHVPNLYNRVSVEDVMVKQQALMQYDTQSKVAYMSTKIIQAQMVFRGAQCKSVFAEAFEVGRIII